MGVQVRGGGEKAVLTPNTLHTTVALVGCRGYGLQNERPDEVAQQFLQMVVPRMLDGGVKHVLRDCVLDLLVQDRTELGD